MPLALANKHAPPEFETNPSIEAETDRLLYGVTMEEFQSQRTSPLHSPELDWRNNGCTSAPDKPFGYDFLPSCQRHDFCYLNYRKQGRFEELKPSCDDNFQRDMYRECGKYQGTKSKHCKSVARMYHWAVQRFGNNYSMNQLPPAMLESIQGAEVAEKPFEENSVSDTEAENDLPLREGSGGHDR